MNARSQNGFTLYELLITVLLIGVILALGVPNLQEFTANSRVTATANDLHGAFLLSRTEAARAREPVTICASADGASCGGAASFDDGWIVFVDETGDGNGIVDGVDVVVKQFPAVDASIDITATDLGGVTARRFTFAPSGMGTGAAGAVASAMVCDDRGNQLAAGGASSARVVVVTPLGRSNVLREVAEIAAQGGCP